VGVLQRFERRLGGLVEGAFARVFGGVVQPVEVAAALQREAADKKAVVGQGRVLVPNSYVVELGASDAGRLGEYDEPLRAELASMVREHAEEQAPAEDATHAASKSGVDLTPRCGGARVLPTGHFVQTAISPQGIPVLRIPNSASTPMASAAK